MTTREAMQRPDQNFSPWADFKEWMAVAFLRAIEAGTEATHSADPQAVAAIEGGQIPGWGGYDYSRLAASVDAMELYDLGDNVEIVWSFNRDYAADLGRTRGVRRAPRMAGSAARNTRAHPVGREERICRCGRQRGRTRT